MPRKLFLPGMTSWMTVTVASAIALAVTVMMTVTMTVTKTAAADGTKQPHEVIEDTVDKLLTKFTDRRAVYKADKGELFALVDEVAVPLFDIKRITRLVLAKNYRSSSPEQREEFGEAFKDLLISTYATALFKYTGDEKIVFTESKIIERKGRKFSKVHSEISIGGDSPVPVVYALMLSRDNEWKIYNLTIGGLNMIVNYRNTYAAAIDNDGLDAVIKSMYERNAAAVEDE